MFFLLGCIFSFHSNFDIASGGFTISIFPLNPFYRLIIIEIILNEIGNFEVHH